MDTFLTFFIALGGVATGMGAIWAAMLARHPGAVPIQLPLRWYDRAKQQPPS